jgi:predicted O-methyltransferase YrrM
LPGRHLQTAGPTAATDPEPDAATALASSRFEPSAYRAASRNEALKLARDARALPEELRWVYLRSLRAAARRDEASGLADADRPAELARLLELAKGSEHVVGFGGRSGLSAIALAMDSPGRQVTVFGPSTDGGHQDDSRGFVDREVRSRVAFRPQPAGELPKRSPAPDLVFVDPHADRLDGLAAARSGERIIRPGGLMVLPGSGDGEVDGLIARLQLDGSFVDGAFIWRKPIERGWGRAPVHTTWERLRLPALGLIVGAAVAVVLPDSGPGMSGNARVGAPIGPASPSRVAEGATRRRPGTAGKRRRVSSTGAPSRVKPRARGRPRRGAGSFSGTGDGRLGTIRVDHPTILGWTAGGSPFVIRSETWRFRPRERSGTTVLTPGTYRQFGVEAGTSWKLKLGAAPRR